MARRMRASVRLPVRTTLLQNKVQYELNYAQVRLPVRTTLLQNIRMSVSRLNMCDYQSERRCSKTIPAYEPLDTCAITSQNDAAPKRARLPVRRVPSAITSQNDAAPKLEVSEVLGNVVRLPVRTTLLQNSERYEYPPNLCDYQSERRCSKTVSASSFAATSAITSQNDAAPKLGGLGERLAVSAITSQNDAAPKPVRTARKQYHSAITSQNDAAPKQIAQELRRTSCAITSQNDAAPKPKSSLLLSLASAITSQNDAAPKLLSAAVAELEGAITSQNDAAPKHQTYQLAIEEGAITSQNDAAPKLMYGTPRMSKVRLPVRTTLLQNHWIKFPSARDGQTDWRRILKAQENAGQ